MLRAIAMLRVCCAVVLLSSTLLVAAQRPDPALDGLVDRLSAYLVDYERQISTVVAEETMRQEVHTVQRVERRTLRSDVGFARLPGEANWLGHRIVRAVDGRTVRRSGRPLSELLTTARTEPTQQIRLLLAESFRYNLGSARTINMPSLPLELLHPQHRHRFAVSTLGVDRLHGRVLTRLQFDEVGPASIVRFHEKGQVWSTVQAWVEPATGAVWQAEVRLFADRRAEPTGVVHVRFDIDRDIGTLVPREMREEFPSGRSRGRGTATYSNFRRFETSGRVVVPQP